MTAAEAHAAAEAEGLSLVQSAENSTGFKGVTLDGKQFKAQLKHDGRNKNLGHFATAEEAALAYARFLGPEGVAKPASMTATLRAAARRRAASRCRRR